MPKVLRWNTTETKATTSKNGNKHSEEAISHQGFLVISNHVGPSPRELSYSNSQRMQQSKTEQSIAILRYQANIMCIHL